MTISNALARMIAHRAMPQPPRTATAQFPEGDGAFRSREERLEALEALKLERDPELTPREMSLELFCPAASGRKRLRAR